MPAMAQPVPRIEGEVRLIASDNPFVLPGADRAAVAGELIVRPELDWTIGPGTTVGLTSTLAYRRYSRRYGDFLTSRVIAAMSHRDSEYLTIDSNLSFANELAADALTESIDFSIDPRSVRRRFAGRTAIAWSPDARSSITGAIGWESLRYPGAALLSPANAYHADLAASRRISPRTSLGLRASATRTDVIGVTRLSAYAVYATISYQAGPAIEGNADIGVEWSGYNLPGNSRARLSGRVSLCYRPNLLDLCLTASRQSEVSGFGGLQSELHVGVAASRRTSERGRISAHADYRRADMGVANSQTGATRVGIAYRHRLTERIAIAGEVDHLSRKFMTSGRNDAVVARLSIIFGRER